jgi:hypothetical protein
MDNDNKNGKKIKEEEKKNEKNLILKNNEN